MAREVNGETKSKWRLVLSGLRNATDGQKIIWDRTAEEESFITTLGKHVILFEKHEGDSTIKFIVKLQDMSGELIDEFDDEDLDDGRFEPNHFVIMQNLFLKIRRQISGADLAITDILTELDKLGDVPF
jgi:hypothetical protein